MTDFSDSNEWNLDDLEPDKSGKSPPEEQNPNGHTLKFSKKKGVNKKPKITVLAVLMVLAMALLFFLPVTGLYMVYQPVVQWGQDSYLSEMGFLAWFFDTPSLEAVTARDGLTGILSFMSVILSDMFFHFLLIAGYLEHREYFWSNPTLKLKTMMTFGLWICTLVIEFFAMYLRKGMNAMILADPSNPLMTFTIHGWDELLGFSALLIFMNATFSYLSILCFGILKKELEK